MYNLYQLVSTFAGADSLKYNTVNASLNCAICAYQSCVAAEAFRRICAARVFDCPETRCVIFSGLTFETRSAVAWLVGDVRHFFIAAETSRRKIKEYSRSLICFPSRKIRHLVVGLGNTAGPWQICRKNGMLYPSR